MTSKPTVATKPRRIREQVIERRAPSSKEEKASPAGRLVEVLDRPDVTAKVRINWTRTAKKLDEKDAEWLTTLLDLFQELDPGLGRLTSFRSPLQLALAFALVKQGGEQNEAVWAALPEKISFLENLKFEGGEVVFNPESAEFSERMAELAAGLYNNIISSQKAGGHDKEALVWHNPLAGDKALGDEKGADLVKFIMRGRAEAQTQGPPCPRCKSRNTLLMVAQFRSNDEAPNESIQCRDCGYH